MRQRILPSSARERAALRWEFVNRELTGLSDAGLNRVLTELERY